MPIVTDGENWWNMVKRGVEWQHFWHAILTLSTNFTRHHAYGYNGNNLKFTIIVTSVTLIPVILELCRVLYAWTSDFLYFPQKSLVRRNCTFSTFATQFLIFAPLFNNWYNYSWFFWRTTKCTIRICGACSFQRDTLRFCRLIFHRDNLNWKPLLFSLIFTDIATARKRQLKPTWV